MSYGGIYTGGKWPDPEEWYFIRDQDAWVRHMVELRAQDMCRVSAEPDQYPCFVRSEYNDGGDSTSCWLNEFLYVKDVYRMWQSVEASVPQAVAEELMR